MAAKAAERMFIGRVGFWGAGHVVSTSPTKNQNRCEDPAFQDVRLIDSGYYRPEDESRTIRQFLLDAPRMDVSIDGKPWARTEEPKALLDHLCSIFPKRCAILAAEFCTQTALAPFFCSVKETLSPEMHFVDGGRQTVRLDSDSYRMEAEKPFKVVDFDDHMNAKVLFIVTLILYVDLETGHVQHRFSRSSLVEKDWVYVEDLSKEDEAAFENGAGAEDIAASALRMKGSNGGHN